MSLFRNYKREFEELLQKYEDLLEKHEDLVAANGEIERLSNDLDSKNVELADLTRKVNDLRNEESDLSILVYTKRSELQKTEENHRQLSGDLESKSKLIGELETEITEKKKETEIFSKELITLLSKVESARVEFEEYDEGLKLIREEESGKKENIIRLQQELEELKYNKEKYSNLEILRVRYDEVYDKVQDILKERAELEFELRDLEQIKKKLIEDINKMRNEMLQQRAAFEQNVVQERISIERELMRMKSDLDDAIKQRQEQLAHLDREFSEAKIRYSKISAAADQVIEELQENEKKLEMIKIERANLNDEATALSKKVETLLSKASALDAEVQLLTRQVDRLNEERQITSGLLEQIRGSIQGLSGSKEAMIENITRLNQQMNDKSIAYSKSNDEYQELLEQIQAKKIEAVNLKGIIEIRNRKLRDIDRELSSLEALRDEYEADLKQILDLQKSLSNDLTNSQEDVDALQDTLTAIRKKFSEIIKIRKARQESARRERARQEYEEEDDYQDDRKPSQTQYQPEPADDEFLKALYADNDRQALEDMTKILLNSRIVLTTADSGVTAFDALKSEPYDLAFFDMNLPGMSPVEIIERMRSSNVYKTIPIFAVLDAPDDNLSRLAMNAGATNLLYKPVSPEILVSELKKYLPV
ncbi:MAG: response regulator [Bacteroidetes bacterium]|nr:response regulator [Bacteroidota bacterium]